MKRLLTMLSITLLLVAFFQNFSEPAIPRDTLLAQFESLRTARLERQATSPIPPPENDAFWSVVNESIAKVALRQPLPEERLLKAVAQEAKKIDTAVLAGEMSSSLQHPLLVRLFYLASQNSTWYPGSWTTGTDRRFQEALFRIADKMSLVDKIDSSAAKFSKTPLETWFWRTSENHIATKQTTHLLILQALRQMPDYRLKKLKNGLTVEQSYLAWQNHWNMWLDERIRHGLLVEVGSQTYSKYTLSAFLNLVDFSEDPRIRDKTRTLIDLILATGGVETLPNGVRGGSKNRKHASMRAEEDGASLYYKMYMTGDIVSVGSSALSGAFLTTSYFPSATVLQLWGRPAQTKAYELILRAPGVADGRQILPQESVFHYTYMTPSYVLGSSILDRKKRYADISAESRSLNLIVNERSLADGLIPLINMGPGDYLCFDRMISVQKKNVLIFQNNYETWIDKKIMSCFGSPKGKLRRKLKAIRMLSTGQSQPVEYDWYDQAAQGVNDVTRNHVDLTFTKDFITETDGSSIFFASPEGTTYVYVKPVASGLSILDGHDPDTKQRSPDFHLKDVYLSDNKFSPVVLVAAPAANFGGSFDAFKKEMLELSSLSYNKGEVTFTPSFRSQLEPGDLFIDSREALATGSWKIPVAGVHEGHGLVAQTPGTDQVVFTVTVPRTGRYSLKARVSGKAKGFSVAFDGKTPVAWASQKEKGWSWQDVEIFGGSNEILLTEGVHSFAFTAVQKKAGIDAIALLAGRNDDPSTILFRENTDRGRGDSLIDGIEANKSPLYLSHTFHTPNIKSRRSTGTWDLRSDTSALLISLDSSSPNGLRRTEGLLLEPEDAIGVDPNRVANDDERRPYLIMDSKTALTFTVNVERAGRHRLFVRNMGAAGTMNIQVNGGGAQAAAIKASSDWAWNYATSSSGKMIEVTLPAGAVTINVKGVSGLKVEAMMLIPVY